MSEQEQFLYDDVPGLYHARIVGDDEQVKLARELLKNGMRIETVVNQTGVSVTEPYMRTMTRETIQQEGERLHEKALHDEAQALYHAKMEGRAEGAFQNMITSIQNLMDNVGWSVEQALSALNVPEAERPKYREHLQKQ